MNKSIIRLKNVQKSFSVKPVLQDVNLDIGEGNILGLIGKNGVGKSTLIKCLLGLLKIDAGNASIFEKESWNLDADTKQRIGYVPQKLSGFRWMRVETMLDYTGSFYAHWNDKKVSNLLKEWDLDPWSKISNLSEGERQKLSIIQAMGHEPDIFIFDEPVASLDPSARRKFIRQLIKINMDEKKTMLFSTHITSDLERIAADIALLKNGTIYFQGDLATLKEQIFRVHIQSFKQLPDRLPFPDIISSHINNTHATLTLNGVSETDIQTFAAKINATATIEYLNLEEIFLELNQ